MDKNTEILEQAEETKAETTEPALTAEEEAEMKDMMEANIFYGHAKSKTNPKMKRNILVTKSGVEVIDLTRTMQALDEAKKLIKSKVANGGNVLFVGTTPASKFAIKESASKLGMPYVTERWLGGTLTNFKTISSRIAHFKKLESEKISGELQKKYTKKERLDIDRELERFEKLLRGIESLSGMPSVVFIADLGFNEIAAEEARKMKIPSVALVNTSTDPDIVDYPIPANDRSSASISYIVSEIEKAVLEGQKVAKAAEAEKIANK